MKHRIVALAALAALIADSTLHASDVAPSPTEAVLVGSVTPSVRVVLISVFDGARNWASPTKATVPPGHYDLKVFCVFADLPPNKAIMGQKTISVEAGHVYEIVATRSENKKQCNLTLSSGS
jgi:hypothetical protein